MLTSTVGQTLAEALDGLIELRPFPAAASRLLAACRDENITAYKLSQIISLDPALAIKLLQIANSPIYGHVGEVSSIQHATVIIGLRSLKNLAVSTAVADLFGSGSDVTEQAREALWLHSLCCGSIAQTLASATGLSLPDEAFLAGVVHDVGKLFFADYRPREYVEILSGKHADSIVDIELQTFGVAHTSVGSECSRTWGLPDVICDVICHHHQPERSDFESELLNLVFVANQLTRIWREEEVATDIGTSDALLKFINVDLSPEEADKLRERAVSEMKIIREVHQSP